MNLTPALAVTTAQIVVPIVIALIALGVVMIFVTRWLTRQTETNHPALDSLDELGRRQSRRRVTDDGAISVSRETGDGSLSSTPPRHDEGGDVDAGDADVSSSDSGSSDWGGSDSGSSDSGGSDSGGSDSGGGGDSGGGSD